MKYLQVFVWHRISKRITDKNEKAPIACSNEDANSGKTMVAVTREKKVKHMAFLKSVHSSSQQTSTKFARVLADTKGFGQAGPSKHSLFMDTKLIVLLPCFRYLLSNLMQIKNYLLVTRFLKK